MLYLKYEHPPTHTLRDVTKKVFCMNFTISRRQQQQGMPKANHMYWSGIYGCSSKIVALKGEFSAAFGPRWPRFSWLLRPTKCLYIFMVPASLILHSNRWKADLWELLTLTNLTCIPDNKWATSWENLFMPYANNKDEDHPAHPRSLISAFAVRFLDSIIHILVKSQNFKTLASLCTWAGRSESYLVANHRTGFLVMWLKWKWPWADRHSKSIVMNLHFYENNFFLFSFFFHDPTEW